MGIKTVETLEKEFQDSLNEIEKVKENLLDYLILLDHVNREIDRAGFPLTSGQIGLLIKNMREEVDKL